MKKSEICKKRDYHIWSTGQEGFTSIVSNTETFYEWDGEVTCQTCGAIAYVYGAWEIFDDEEE
jgi:hypothetical protein